MNTHKCEWHQLQEAIGEFGLSCNGIGIHPVHTDKAIYPEADSTATYMLCDMCLACWEH